MSTKKLRNYSFSFEHRPLKEILAIFFMVFLWIFCISAWGINRNMSIEQKSPNVAEISQKALENKIRRMVAGYPMEAMAYELSQQDEKVASFMVSIAKKESNWGKRVPVLNGADCYNYWGFRRKNDRMGSGGHTCFDDPREAVMTVAKRIDYLVYEEKVDTPKEMILWKCGASCAGHSSYDVSKWIKDVNYYYQKMQN